MNQFGVLRDTLKELAGLMDQSPRHQDRFNKLERQLEHNISQAEERDTQALQDERKQLIAQMNRLSLNAVKRSFTESGLGDPQKASILIRDNLALIVVLALVIFVALFVLRISRLVAFFPCRYPVVVASCLSIVALATTHVLWRMFHSKVNVVGLPIGLAIAAITLPITEVLDSIHPWTLPHSIFAIGSTSIATLALLLLLMSPARPEPIPRVRLISVQYLHSSQTDNLIPGQVEEGIQVREGRSVVLAADTGDTSNMHCRWYADSRSGTLRDEGECTSRYTAPFGRKNDSIRLQVLSPCKTAETWTSLPVEITDQ